MTNEEFSREALYQQSMNLFQGMRSKGLITSKQYALIDTKMKEKYRPVFGILCSGYNLQSSPDRVMNCISKEEVHAGDTKN